MTNCFLLVFKKIQGVRLMHVTHHGITEASTTLRLRKADVAGIKGH